MKISPRLPRPARFRRQLGALLMLLAVPALAAPAMKPPAALPAPAPLPAATVAISPVAQIERLARLDASRLPASARAAVATSLARWRKLPPLPAGRFLLVNIPAFEIRLQEGAVTVARWRAIVGTPRTSTPEFTGVAAGVILNPWWNVPDSIVHESVGRMMARRPAEAARRGYVRDGDRYRQRPGPDNQLGQMKLDFSNPASIGIHDTPARVLFARDKRALSHGCIRVDDALGFAATLLNDGSSRESLAARLPGGETQRLAFGSPLPVIIAYFTAEVSDAGALVIHDDVYRRDQVPTAVTSAMPDSECGDR